MSSWSTSSKSTMSTSQSSSSRDTRDLQDVDLVSFGNGQHQQQHQPQEAPMVYGHTGTPITPPDEAAIDAVVQRYFFDTPNQRQISSSSRDEEDPTGQGALKVLEGAMRRISRRSSLDGQVLNALNQIGVAGPGGSHSQHGMHKGSSPAARMRISQRDSMESVDFEEHELKFGDDDGDDDYHDHIEEEHEDEDEEEGYPHHPGRKRRDDYQQAKQSSSHHHQDDHHTIAEDDDDEDDPLSAYNHARHKPLPSSASSAVESLSSGASALLNYAMPYRSDQLDPHYYPTTPASPHGVAGVVIDYDDSIVAKYVRRRNQRMMCMCVLVMGLVGATAAAVYGVARHAPSRRHSNNSNNNNTPANNQPSSHPNTTTDPALQFLSQVSALSQLQDPNSIQARAYQWLRDDEALEEYLQSGASDTRSGIIGGAGQLVLERYAMAVFYYATSGMDHNNNNNNNEGNLPVWKNANKWMTDAPICEWFGVSCENNNNAATTTTMQMVTGVKLANNGLVGYIPGEVQAWMGLKVLDLSGNGLVGSLPLGLGDLTDLVEMRLNDNSIGGDLSVDVLGKMNKLQVLHLQNNQMQGAIPYWINLLTSLSSFKLSHNQFIDPIPSHLGQLPRLTELDLSNNAFSSQIPEELGRCSMLRQLNLSNNQLTGRLPQLFVLLTYLEILAIDGNRIEGPLPNWMEVWDELEIFRVHDNALTGDVPQELGNMVGLSEVSLHGNSLVGSVPEGLCVHGEHLQVTADCVGESPEVVCGCCTCYDADGNVGV